MLKPPHTHYSRIYTYHVEGTGLPVINDPDLIGSWEEDGVTILIFHLPKDKLIETLCRQNSCHLFYQADLDYKDWEMGREVIPFTVETMRIAPVWDKGEADILLDPSIVFGNGFHPSTRMCLEALIRYSKNLSKGFTALDLGCGTGLLGICAARLGASSVMAIDYNPLACEVTKKNAACNNVEKSITIKQADLRTELPGTGVDVIMANLHHELLADLFQNPLFWEAGLFILSGFMPGAEEKLLAALPASPPRFLDRGGLDKWRVWILGNN